MKYIVWVKDDVRCQDNDDEMGRFMWQHNGDGPMGKATAERIVKDLRKMGYKARCLPVGCEL